MENVLAFGGGCGNREASRGQDIALAPVRLLHLRVKWTARCEHGVNRLNGAVLGLRTEEEDNGHLEQDQTRKEEVCSICQRAKHDRVDEDRLFDTNSPASDTESVTLSSHFQRENLIGDQEGDSSPSGSIAQVEEGKHGSGRGCEAAHFGLLTSASLVQTSSDEIDGEEAKSSADQALPPTESVNDLSADDGTDDRFCSNHQPIRSA